jgi:short-subunit dehydrogenase
MNLNTKRILLTGAAGGIGYPLAMALAAKGAKLVLVDRDADRLQALCHQINQTGGLAIKIIEDFQQAKAAQNVVDMAIGHLGAIDILINSAGILDFVLFDMQSAERIAQMMHINATVPIQLTRAVLPGFIGRNCGQVVNVGSIFGSIGFPHFATYSASKFAIHGFSQALRRELQGSNIVVTYIAPRAVKTPMNNGAASRMLTATKTAMDDPLEVVAQIISTIEQEKQEHYIGQPESFFAWLNAVLPCAVNMGLKKQVRIARQFVTKP